MMKRNSKNISLPLPEITLIGTFSRRALVKMWFNALAKMKLPRKKIHLLIYDNTDNKELEKALQEQLAKIRGDYLSVKFFKSNREGGRTILGQSNDNWFKSKLKPIWEMWKDLSKMIKTELFFLIEDDTIAPAHAFEKLWLDFHTLPSPAFVTGIETGRAQFPWSPVRLGVHYLEVKKNKIIKRISLNPYSKGIKEVDGSGVYCFIARLDAYKKAIKQMRSFVSTVPFFAMDNLLTYIMKQNGFNLYADFSVWCDHVHLSGTHIFRFNKKQAVHMADVWMPEFNNYAQGIEIKK